MHRRSAQSEVNGGGADKQAEQEEAHGSSGKPLRLVQCGKERIAARRRNGSGGGSTGKWLGANRAMGRHIGVFDLGDKGIALARNGLDERRFFGRVAKNLAEFVDRGIDVGVEVDVDVGGPEAFAQILAGHDLAGFFDENEENLMDLGRQFDADAFAIESLPAKIIGKVAETNVAIRRRRKWSRGRFLLEIIERNRPSIHRSHL